MPRRRFLRRVTEIAGGAAAASLLLPLLEPNYAWGQQVDPGDDPTFAAARRRLHHILAGAHAHLVDLFVALLVLIPLTMVVPSSRVRYTTVVALTGSDDSV